MDSRASTGSYHLLAGGRACWIRGHRMLETYANGGGAFGGITDQWTRSYACGPRKERFAGFIREFPGKREEAWLRFWGPDYRVGLKGIKVGMVTEVSLDGDPAEHGPLA